MCGALRVGADGERATCRKNEPAAVLRTRQSPVSLPRFPPACARSLAKTAPRVVVKSTPQKCPQAHLNQWANSSCPQPLPVIALYAQSAGRDLLSSLLCSIGMADCGCTLRVQCQGMCARQGCPSRGGNWWTASGLLAVALASCRRATCCSSKAMLGGEDLWSPLPVLVLKPDQRSGKLL